MWMTELATNTSTAERTMGSQSGDRGVMVSSVVVLVAANHTTAVRDLAPAGRDDVALSDRFRTRAGPRPGDSSIRARTAVPPAGAIPRAQCYHATEEPMATTTRRIATEDDLLAMPKDGQKYELVDGEIRVSPAGDRHSAMALALGARLLAFTKTHRLGHVMGADAGFRLPTKNIRSPDVSFVAPGRFPEDKPPDDFGNVAPDLAVEVLSPHDRPRHVLDKVGEYLEAGVRLIWVIDPRQAPAVVYPPLSG